MVLSFSVIFHHPSIPLDPQSTLSGGYYYYNLLLSGAHETTEMLAREVLD